jgi:enterobactin synthetase component D
MPADRPSRSNRPTAAIDTPAANFITSAGWLALPAWPPIYRCGFDVAGFDASAAAAGMLFPANIARAVTKRQAEFTAGRLAARMCLAKNDIHRFDLVNGADRAPIWPDGLVGSITHTHNVALCTVLPAAVAQGIGLDIEPPIDAVRSGAIRRIVVTAAEWDLVQAAFPPNLALTFAFSAKESLFKALYPQVRRFLDFSAARITHIDMADHSFSIALNEDWSPQWRTGVTLKGQFHFLDGSVLTSVVLAAA